MSEKPSLDALAQDIQHVEQEYRKNVTVVTARPRITQAAFVAWGAVIAMMAIFFLVTVGWYGVQGIFDDQRYEDALLQNSNVTQKYLFAAAPEDLRVGEVQSVSVGDEGMYDVYVEIENPNPRHAVEFSYIFSYDAGETDVRKGFFNPGEKAYIIASRASVGKPRAVSLSLSDISWKYISPKEIPNVNIWYVGHAVFSVDNIFFARDITYPDAIVSRTTFTVVNHSPYSYWEPSFTVRIMRGSLLLGIAEVVVGRFRAGEERTIDMRWFGDLPQTATVLVTPRIPFFDKDAYMMPEQSSMEDVRNRWTGEGR